MVTFAVILVRFRFVCVLAESPVSLSLMGVLGEDFLAVLIVSLLSRSPFVSPQ